MNKRIRFAYIFLLKLPGALFIGGVFGLILSALFNYINFYGIFIFSAVQFTALLAVKEMSANKAFSGYVQISTGCLFACAGYIIFGGGLFVITGVLVFTLTLRSLVSGSYEYRGSFLNAGMALFGIIMLYQYLTGNSYAIRPFALCLAITVICNQLCFLINNMERYIYSYKCRRQAKRTLDYIVRGGFRLASVYMLLITALAVFSLARNFTAFVPPEGDIDSKIEAWGKEVFSANRESPLEAEELIEVEIESSFQPHMVRDENEKGREAAPQWIVRLAVALFAIGLLAIGLIRNNKARGHSEHLPAEQDEIIYIEDCAPAAKRKKSHIGLFSNNWRVRKIFISKAESYMKKGLIRNKRLTAKRMLDTISGYEPADALGELYHRARYGDEPVTREELLRLKGF